MSVPPLGLDLPRMDAREYIINSLNGSPEIGKTFAPFSELAFFQGLHSSCALLFFSVPNFYASTAAICSRLSN